MCIYRDQPREKQRSTLASILAASPNADILWSNVIDLLRSLTKVAMVREMNGSILLKCLDANQSYRVVRIPRPRGTRYINSCQIYEIRGLLDMLEINPEENCDLC
ncbi:MAG: hypothetical protein LH702_11260 [Phormidesmis sp. CAN_BIN44]|nr:hypothetical protein [Phormidesmis sp. CAN_BIN44]